jgi:hypothetical protein
VCVRVRACVCAYVCVFVPAPIDDLQIQEFVERAEVSKLRSLGAPYVVECRARREGEGDDDDDEAAGAGAGGGGGRAAGAGAGGAAAVLAPGKNTGPSDPRILAAFEWLTMTVKKSLPTLQKRVDTAVQVEASRTIALEAERESEVAKDKALREAAAAK